VPEWSHRENGPLDKLADDIAAKIMLDIVDRDQ
jgi:hypothetical protein